MARNTVEAADDLIKRALRRRIEELEDRLDAVKVLSGPEFDGLAKQPGQDFCTECGADAEARHSEECWKGVLFAPWP